MGGQIDPEQLRQAYGLTDERILLEGPIHVRPVVPGTAFGRTLHGLKGKKGQWSDSGGIEPHRVLVTDKRIILTKIRGPGGVGPRPVPVTPVNIAINVVQLVAKVYQTAKAGEPTNVRSLGIDEVSIIESLEDQTSKGLRGWMILQTPPDEKGKQYLLFHGLAWDGSLDTAGNLVDVIQKLKARNPSMIPPQNQTTPAPGTTTSAFCTNCGVAVAVDEKFCHVCGTSLRSCCT